MPLGDRLAHCSLIICQHTLPARDYEEFKGRVSLICVPRTHTGLAWSSRWQITIEYLLFTKWLSDMHLFFFLKSMSSKSFRLANSTPLLETIGHIPEVRENLLRSCPT